MLRITREQQQLARVLFTRHLAASTTTRVGVARTVLDALGLKILWLLWETCAQPLASLCISYTPCAELCVLVPENQVNCTNQLPNKVCSVYLTPPEALKKLKHGKSESSSCESRAGYATSASASRRVVSVRNDPSVVRDSPRKTLLTRKLSRRADNRATDAPIAAACH